MSKAHVVALACSDLHFSHKPPIARSSEEHWFIAIERCLQQLRNFVEEYKVPLIVAGDIFDKWNMPPEIINFIITRLPHCYAIPGQHDLANHSYQEIKRSAYYTLVAAEVITNLKPKRPTPLEEIRLHGFPYGYEVQLLEKPHDLALEIAVVHQYIWDIPNNSYQGAPELGNVKNFKKQVQGYDVVIVGDNHKGFEVQVGNKERPTTIYNCGAFLRRKMDERNYKPAVGLIWSDGKVTREYLDVHEDKFLEAEGIVEALSSLGMETFLEELTSLGDKAIDFSSAIDKLLQREKVSQNVRKIVLSALGGRAQ